jgi:hypothetical protein
MGPVFRAMQGKIAEHLAPAHGALVIFGPDQKNGAFGDGPERGQHRRLDRCMQQHRLHLGDIQVRKSIKSGQFRGHSCLLCLLRRSISVTYFGDSLLNRARRFVLWQDHSSEPIGTPL